MKKLLLLLAVFGIRTGISQNDSSLVMKEVPETVQQHLPSLEQSSNILNGIEHVPYAAGIEGQPYLFNEFYKGMVVYEGITYNNVDLKYDRVKDELILRHPNGLQVILFTPRVQLFKLQDRKFLNVPRTQVKRDVFEGFYELLSEGRVNLFVKRSTELEEKITSGSIHKQFIGKNSYMASANGNFYRIKNDNALFELMPGIKNDAKDFLKQQGVSFKANPELALISIAEYYNQLRN